MLIENHIFKDTKFIQSPNFNERPNESDIRLIVIHSISLPPNVYGGDYVEKFFLNKLDSKDHKYFENIVDLKVSSHIYIKRTGEILQFVPFNKRAWHAGKSSYDGVADCNDFSIGIELEGMDNDEYTSNQYHALIQATKVIIKNYPLITKDLILGHSDISPDRKTDPGLKFNWDRFLDSL